MKKTLCFLLLGVLTFTGFAQSPAVVQGRITDATTGASLPDVPVELPYLKMMTYTDDRGHFQFNHVRWGNYQLITGGGYILKEPLKIAVNKALVDVGDVAVVVHEIPTLSTVASTIFEDTSEPNTAGDDGENDSGIPGVLLAARDPFLSAAAFTFGALNYRLRGYGRDQTAVYINGMLMNDPANGFAIWSNWGGLNDVLRNQTATFGLQAADAGFGRLAGLTQMDATAASQRQQTRITYSFSNRNYRHRSMLTYSSGLMQNGWAFAASASKRWAKEGYFPGTFYDSHSFFLAISKKMREKSFLHLTVFAAPTHSGKSMPATKEAMDLAGTPYYNPNWGYVNGMKRNARINSNFQPMAIFSYDFRPNRNSHFNMSLMYQQGYNGSSTFDWYNALDPRPDNFRNLPSFYLNNPTGADTPAAAALEEQLRNNPDRMQLDWQRLYETNRMNIDPITGMSGSRSLYVIGQDRTDSRKAGFSAGYNKLVGAYTRLYAGAAILYQQSEHYRKMLDVLGGDYYVNLNQFAERTYAGNPSFYQNDLHHPNGIVRVGDIYAYHYKSRFMKSWLWGQVASMFPVVDIFFALQMSWDQFSREGVYRNGLFPDDSEGKSAQQSFFNNALKGGITYKIDGRNYIFLNGSYATESPTFDHTFIAARVRNATVDHPDTERTLSMEGGYLLKSPRFNGRLTGFVTDSKDITDIKRFYHEDYRSFVNYVMRHIAIRNLGLEAALQTDISSNVGISFVGVWTQSFYTNRPDISIYRDNDTNTKAEHSIAWLKNYIAVQGPQSAYTLGLNYHAPRLGYAYLNAAYLHRNFVAVNPARRTAEAVDLIEVGSEQWHKILDQEMLPAIFTLDLFMGKSFPLNKVWKSLSYSSLLYINVGINNLLNNKQQMTAGYEQLRFDYATRNPDRFATKYVYGYGINYFINFSLRF